MKRRLYFKNRQFLKNFFVVLTCVILLAFIIVGSVYKTSLHTLKKEIESMSESKTQEMANRVEEVLEKCNEIAISLSLDQMIQMYFVCQEPNTYVKEYYDKVGATLNVQGMSYIDSIIVYAPEYGRMYDSSSLAGNIILSEEGKTDNTHDISWMDEYNESGKEETIVFARAKSGRWPYYLTVMQRWHTEETEGIILVNVDLNKLYAHLLMDNESSMQFYLLDDKERVIMSPDKQALYMPIDEIDGFENFQCGESFSRIDTVGNEAYTYVQQELGKNNFTCVSIMPIGDYFVRLTQLQTQLIWMICIAAFLAVLVACIYSMNLIKPQRENLLLKEELNQSEELLKDTRLVALQTQINPHFMFNTLNIASLMVESDCGDGHPVAQLLGALSDILRYSLSKQNNVSLREEITCVERYLEVMKYRYGEFEVDIQVEEKIYDYMVPRLTMQPLIENALQHGISLCMDTRPGRIEIRGKEVQHIYQNGKELPSVCINIIDNGLGIDEEKLEELRKLIKNQKKIPEEHIGLFNVAQRFYLLYHNEQQVTIDSTFGRGTNIQLVFPVTKNKD